MFIILSILFLSDSVKGFMGNNVFEGMKFLMEFFAVGIVGFLYLLPSKK